MNLSERVFLSIGVVFTMIGCGSDSSSSGPAAGGAIQVVNAITDAPSLTVKLELSDDEDVITEFGTLRFQDASEQRELARDIYLMKVTYIDPESDSEVTLIDDEPIEIDSNTLHSVILRGSFRAPDALVLEREIDVFDTDLDQIEVQIINLTDDSVAVYLGDPADAVGSDNLVDTVTAGSNTSPVLIDDDDNSAYRLRLTNDGDTDLIYDSGEFSIPLRNSRMFIISDAVSPEPNAKTATILTSTGSTVFSNEAAEAAIRVLNLVADDVSATVEVTIPSTGNVVESQVIEFRDVTPFVVSDPSFINVSATLTSDPTNTLNATVSLNEDTFFTIVVGGSAIDETVSVLATEAEIRPSATESSIQFINGLRETTIEDFDRVDLYVLSIGDALADSAPVIGQVPFLSGDNVIVPATTVDLVVTTAGTQSIIAGPTRLILDGSSALLVAATEASGGGLPNQMVVNTVDVDQ